VLSDDTRERTLARLRDGYASGELRTATFDRRVDVALRARTHEELGGLTVDLPASRGRWQRAERAVREWLWPAPEPGGLLAAAGLSAGSLTLGRASTCELVLTDDSVSRRHATLRLRQGRWFLVDLNSSNGSWVNGRRVFDAEVLPGDEIRLGAVRFRL
jgi:hypothetical protein